METKQWLAQCPPDLLAFFKSVPFLNSLRSFRMSTFQMAGKYDGAMSQECVDLFRREYAAIDAFLEALKS